MFNKFCADKLIYWKGDFHDAEGTSIGGVQVIRRG